MTKYLLIAACVAAVALVVRRAVARSERAPDQIIERILSLHPEVDDDEGERDALSRLWDDDDPPRAA